MNSDETRTSYDIDPGDSLAATISVLILAVMSVSMVVGIGIYRSITRTNHESCGQDR